MRREVYHTVEARMKGVPDQRFLLHPDGALREDERTCDEMVEAARGLEGKGDVVEVSVSHVDKVLTPGCWRIGEAVDRLAVAMLRRRFTVASPWDVTVDLRHRIVVYKR